jgi:hypothetical protein
MALAIALLASPDRPVPARHSSPTRSAGNTATYGIDDRA